VSRNDDDPMNYRTARDRRIGFADELNAAKEVSQVCLRIDDYFDPRRDPRRLAASSLVGDTSSGYNLERRCARFAGYLIDIFQALMELIKMAR